MVGRRQARASGTAVATRCQRASWPAPHGHASLALDLVLQQQRQEVQGEERVYTGFVLEEDGRDFMHGLNLFEAFVDLTWVPNL